MIHRTKSPLPQIGQGEALNRSTTLETVRPQAGYSLGNDVHAFYTAPVFTHDCALCRGQRTCAGRQSVQEPPALQSSPSICLN